MRNRLSLSTHLLRVPLALAALALSPPVARAQTRLPTDSNVVFANVGNTALLMDVYRPQRPNRLGIVFIAGSGWGSPSAYPRTYDDTPLKDDARESTGYIGNVIQALLDAGFTVFSINHRFAPEVRFPAPLYDAQRAVRFIRANAARYDINAEKLGAIGHSSGVHLAALLGVTDTTIDNPDRVPSQSGSSRVQAVVTLSAPFLVTSINAPRIKIVENLLGSLPARSSDGTYPMTPEIAAASPLSRVTANAAAMLMYQAENDSVVLKTSVPLMAARLSAVKVPNKFVLRRTGNHTPAYDVAEIVAWFRRYLD